MRQLRKSTRFRAFSFSISILAGALSALPAHAFLDDLSSSYIEGIVTGIGVSVDHRNYEPATPLKRLGSSFSFGAEATLVKIPDISQEALGVPIFPAVKLHIHQGLSDRVDLSASGLYLNFGGLTIFTLGGGLRIAILLPEEGPSWSIGLNYNYSSISMVTTHSLTPHLLVSRKLKFADPYLGIGYQVIYGFLSYDHPSSAIPNFVLGQATVGNFIAFTGVSFHTGAKGFQIAVEGAYSLIGAPTIGMKLSFAL